MCKLRERTYLCSSDQQRLKKHNQLLAFAQLGVILNNEGGGSASVAKLTLVSTALVDNIGLFRQQLPDNSRACKELVNIRRAPSWPMQVMVMPSNETIAQWMVSKTVQQGKSEFIKKPRMTSNELCEETHSRTKFVEGL